VRIGEIITEHVSLRCTTRHRRDSRRQHHHPSALRNRVPILYGAFTVDGEFIGESNQAFDKFCRSTRGYGLKEVRDLERLAADVGLACVTPRAMPANNLLLRFVKAERGPLQKMLSWAGVEELVL